MIFGAGSHTYKVAEDWWQPPERWEWGWISAVACDSRGRVYVYSRSEHPLTVFGRDGAFVVSWGDNVLKGAHGLYIDAHDNVYCVDHETHCVHAFDRDGELTMTLGTPGQPGLDGEPFNQPTDLAVASTGELLVSDGYGNRRVHKFSPDGELLLSWGEPGSGPGQFALPHCVRVDRNNRVWVCDRENNRIQVFDLGGHFLTEWTGLLRPDALCFDPNDDVVYVAELTNRVSIYTLEGEQIAQWGDAHESDRPGEFLGAPHGIWVDSQSNLYVSEVGVDRRLQKFIRQGSGA